MKLDEHSILESYNGTRGVKFNFQKHHEFHHLQYETTNDRFFDIGI